MWKVVVLLLGLMVFVATGCEAYDPATGAPYADERAILGGVIPGFLMFAFMATGMGIFWLVTDRRSPREDRFISMGLCIALISILPVAIVFMLLPFSFVLVVGMLGAELGGSFALLTVAAAPALGVYFFLRRRAARNRRTAQRVETVTTIHQ